MNTCTLRNHGLTYIVVLIFCQLFDYATSNTLSFINLAHPMVIGQIIHFEDIISVLTYIALAACLLIYLFGQQPAVYRSIIVTAALTTFGLIMNIAGLLLSLVTRQVNPPFLLIDAAIVYASTVLLFAVWYWILDYASQEARCSGKDVPRYSSSHRMQQKLQDMKDGNLVLLIISSYHSIHQVQLVRLTHWYSRNQLK